MNHKLLSLHIIFPIFIINDVRNISMHKPLSSLQSHIFDHSLEKFQKNVKGRLYEFKKSWIVINYMFIQKNYMILSTTYE